MAWQHCSAWLDRKLGALAHQMKKITRRGVLEHSLTGAAGLAALGPTALFATPALAARPVNRPIRPMKLTRLLERGLSGNDTLRVERSWHIEFSEQGRGLAITGKQVAVSVTVPPALAALARIEEARSTEDMFPILLSSGGEILTAGRFMREEDLAKALRVAEDMINRRERSAAAKVQHSQFLSQLQQAGAPIFEQLPRDLFFPAGEPHRAIRKVSLPDGISGEFEVIYEARKAPRSDWLEQATRRIITRIEQSERRSVEEWWLTEI